MGSDGVVPAVQWTPELAQAVANHERMPGIERLRSQYVRYRGQTEAKLSPTGWSYKESIAGLQRLAEQEASDAGAGGAPGDVALELQRIQSTRDQHPAQVSLLVNIAPAEFCLPMKNDRQFKPHFQVQVDVSHTGNLHLPLRLKAYVISQEDRNSILEWLPEELDADNGTCPTRRPLTDLKGSIVVSHVFKSAEGDVARSFQESGNPGVALERNASNVSRFPSSNKTGSRVLTDSDSIRSTENDADMATTLNIEPPSQNRSDIPGGLNTILAQYEFKNLEFAKPTRMNKVYMLFACLVMGQDLLYTVFDVPCISICRAEQRHKALLKLGMPANAFDEARANFGTPYGAELPNPTSLKPLPDIDRSLEATFKRMHASGNVNGGAPGPRSIPPPAPPAAPPSGDDTVGVTQEDYRLAEVLGQGGLPSLMSGLSFGMVDGSTMDEVLRNLKSLASDPGGESDLQKFLDEYHRDCLNSSVQQDQHSLRQLLAENALQSVGAAAGKDGLEHVPSFAMGGLEPPGGGVGLSFGAPDNVGVSEAVAEQLQRISGDHTASSADLNASGIDTNGHSNSQQYVARGGVEEPEDDRFTRRFSDDSSYRPRQRTMAHNSAQGPAAPAQQGGFANFGSVNVDMSQLNISQGGRERLPSQEGINQKMAYDWIIAEYNNAGLQRRLLGQDMKALLSQAGFPCIAGLDLNIRVSPHQFAEFQHQFSMVLAMLRRISGLWNMQNPCMVSGFDMDRSGASAALAAEPPGTFICRFSMNQIGCLVLSCKVAPGPGSPASAEGDLFHATINVDDLQDCSVEQLILSLPHASHVLDVYTNRRVDKRNILGSGYMRVRNLQHSGMSGDIELDCIDG